MSSKNLIFHYLTKNGLQKKNFYYLKVLKNMDLVIGQIFLNILERKKPKKIVDNTTEIFI